MTPERLAEIAARAAKATTGPYLWAAEILSDLRETLAYVAELEADRGRMETDRNYWKRRALIGVPVELLAEVIWQLSNFVGDMRFDQGASGADFSADIAVVMETIDSLRKLRGDQ